MAAWDQKTRIAVRRARGGDLERVRDLLSQLAGKPLTRAGASNRMAMVARDPGQKLMVACAGAHVVGLLAFRIRENIEEVSRFGEVSAIVVDPDWRCKEVGRRLMETAEKLARRKRCIGLWLVSGFGREEEAHKFYARLGFEKTGVRFKKLLSAGPA